MRDLTVPSVSSLPLSIMVRSRAFIGVEFNSSPNRIFYGIASLKVENNSLDDKISEVSC